MFQHLITYFKIIQYQILYYFLGAFAVFDDLQNRNRNKLGKHYNFKLINNLILIM